MDDPSELKEDYQKEHGYYNGNNNCIYYDEHEKLYYFTTGAYGDSRQSTFSYPLYFMNDVDRLEIRYKYTTKDVVGGSFWAKIISWKYNGTQVFKEEEDDKKVFIKKTNGKTTINFRR